MRMTLRVSYLIFVIALGLTFIVWPAMALEKQSSGEKVAAVVKNSEGEINVIADQD